jgi:hypothetical protein
MVSGANAPGLGPMLPRGFPVCWEAAPLVAQAAKGKRRDGPAPLPL